MITNTLLFLNTEGEYFGFNLPKAEAGELRDGCQIIPLGNPYTEIRKVFMEIREKLGINARGFGDMSIKEIAQSAPHHDQSLFFRN